MTLFYVPLKKKTHQFQLRHDAFLSVRIFYPDEREFFVSLLDFLALLNELDSFKHFLYHVLLSHSRKVKYTGKIVYSTLKNSSHLEFNSESLSTPFLQ